jgi:glycosyltransferase involved in cell wall biosynthesis
MATRRADTVRVLFVTERFPPDRGGAAASAARQVANLAPCLDRLDVLRLAGDLPPARVVVEEHESWRLYRVGAAPAVDESLQLLYQTSSNLVRAHGHHVLHGFYAVHAGYVAAAVARALGRRSVVSLRGNDVDRAMFHGPRLPFLLWTLERADALVGVSREILGKVTALTGRSAGLHRVPNGVDGAAFSASAPDSGEASPEHAGAPRPWIGFAGELRLKKGLPVLQALAARLALEGRGTLFWIGGVRSEERPAVEAWRRAAPQAAGRVRELPYLADAGRLAARYRAMDLMVFPSLWEGMPNALLEAMACGRPVLATAVGACPEVIEDGVSGFLVPPERLDAFAEAALGVLARPAEERARLGAAARARALGAFTPEAERDAILAAYAGLA